MVRTSKSANQTTVPSTSVTSTTKSAPVVESLNVSEKVAKSKKSSKSVKTASSDDVKESEPVVVYEPVVVSEPVVTQLSNAVVDVNDNAVVVSSEISSLSTKMSEISAKLQLMTTSLSAVRSDYKLLEKLVSRELKNAQKNSRKKKSLKNRQPSGFVKPTLISDELAQFLGKTFGTEMARTDVSKEINQYIRLNSLQDKSNGRKIIPDNKLATLLKITGDDELTYFNLQRYMKHHFIKVDNTVSTSV